MAIQHDSDSSVSTRISRPQPGLFGRFAAWDTRRRFGRDLSPVDAYLHHPKLLFGYGGFEMAVERSKRVDDRLKSLAETKAAAIIGCEWCMDFGSWVAINHGVPEKQLRELANYRESDAFSELERLVLDYAVQMTSTPPAVEDATVQALREHLDDAQLVELTNVIALENLRSRFNHALGLTSQGFSEGQVCVRPEAARADAIESQPAERASSPA